MGVHDLKLLLCVVFLVITRETFTHAAAVTTIGATTVTASTSTPTVSSTRVPTTTARPTTTPNGGTTSASSSGPTVTTPTADELCALNNNKTCADCLGVAGAKCLWCKTDSSCHAYPLSKVLPTEFCSLSEARWGACWLNFEALIIAVSTLGGIIVLTITCCCVYCCCCRNSKRKYAKEDARYNSQKMERKAKSDERRSERKERLDEIRRKYGLVKDEPYQRFES